MTVRQSTPALYLSMPHACSYLPERETTLLFVDPQHRMSSADYSRFLALGFRRSGDLVYRPHCRRCNACVPVRVPVADFRPDRGQRRVWRRNQDLRVLARPADFDAEHFELYLRYQTGRHAGSGMDDPDPGRYIGFMLSRGVDTALYELRLGGQLVGVAVVDLLPDAWSAMYTFYDPDLPARALGVYTILWQIAEAQRLGLTWLYLGYWIGESPKMAYKTRYQPLEMLIDGRWQRPGQSPETP